MSRQPGRYRLRRRDDEALFGYTVGAHSLKRLSLPENRTIFRARIAADGEVTDLAAPAPPEGAAPVAFIGARSCELHGRSDSGAGSASAARTPTRRSAPPSESLFIVAVQCGEAGGTCFCASMGTGPELGGGYDIALTEVIDAERHCFVAHAGSERGAEVLAEVPQQPPDEAALAAARAAPARAAAQMGRTLETDGLKELLYRNYEHPRWDEVAERCLSCGNCTMVCPTCFCTTVEDVTDLTGEHIERNQRWDSCFTVDYSYIHGGAVRELHPLPLPPVDDPQARHLVRPVRHLGLRRMRALHHVVPGGDRHHRGGARDPRAARRDSMQTLDELITTSPVFEGMSDRPPEADRRLRAQRPLRCRRLPAARGGAGRHVLPDPPRQRSRSRCTDRGAARS